MKLTITLLLFGSLSIYAKGKAQKVNLNTRNTSLQEVFNQIEQQTGYSFVYTLTMLPKPGKVSVVLKEATVKQALDSCLKNQPLAYSIVGNSIILRPQREKSLPATTFYSVAKMVEVHGKITDSTGAPLTGAAVTIFGTHTSTLTDNNGNFSIRVDDNDKLEITYVGYTTQIIAVEGRSELNIVLKSSAQKLGDIVVVGFGSQNKTNLVSAVSTITSEDLNYPVASLSNMLQGKVAGAIAIQRSGEPGYDNSSFWIRGVSSFAGGTSPLIIVDGVPRPSFDDIDPNEIATLSILKDATATAVYGAEGANGVVVITTKRGVAAKTKISYRGEYSTGTPLRMPTYLNSAQYLSLYNEGLTNQGQQPLYSDSLIQNYANHVDPDLYPDDDWMNILLKKHTNNSTHNITFTGGNDKARYFVSGSFFNQGGIFNQNSLAQYNNNVGLKRYNLRSNIDLNITNSTLLSISLAGQYLETNYAGNSSTTILQAISKAVPFIYPVTYSTGQLASAPIPGADNANPYNLLMESGYTNEYRTSLQSIVNLKQDFDKLTKGLSAKVTVSFESDGDFYSTRTKSISTYYATGRDSIGNLILNQTANGSGNLSDPSNSNDANKNIYLEGSINYARTFNSLHDVTGLLLTYEKESQQQNTIGLPFRTRGYVGRVTYAYDKRYSIEANFGVTGSENFASGHRYGIFPSAGFAWNVSNEPYYPDRLKDIVSSMKVRFTMGRTGNDNTGGARFLYRGTYGSSTGFSMGYGQTGALNTYGGEIEGQFQAPDLSWEIQDEKNVGLDLSFLKDKITLNVDYYHSLRYNILLQRRTVLDVAGFRQAPWQNFGKVSDHGVDLTLSAHQPIGKNSLITVQGNFTYAHNKVLEYDEIPPLYPWMAVTGKSVGALALYVADGLYTDNDFDITSNSDGSKSYALKAGLPVSSLSAPMMPGDIKYKDLNNDGIIDQFDQTRDYKGAYPETPEINYGFGVTYQYKGFYISTYFTGIAHTSTVLGRTNQQLFFPFHWTNESNVRAMTEDRWTQQNPSQDVLMPRTHPGAFANNEAPSTWWLRNGSFFRLKNAEFGYNFSKKDIHKLLGLNTNGAKLYIMGYNLITWDHIKYWDPEQGNASEGMAYPQLKSFTVGLQLNL